MKEGTWLGWNVSEVQMRLGEIFSGIRRLMVLSLNDVDTAADVSEEIIAVEKEEERSFHRPLATQFAHNDLTCASSRRILLIIAFFLLQSQLPTAANP